MKMSRREFLKLSAATDAAVYFDDAAIAMGERWAPANLLNGGMEEWTTEGKLSKWETGGNGYAQPVPEEVEGRGTVAAFDRQETKLNIASAKFDVVGGLPYIFTADVYETVAHSIQLYIQV